MQVTLPIPEAIPTRHSPGMRKEIAAAFRAAKDSLSHGPDDVGYTFICNALQDLQDLQGSLAAARIVQERLKAYTVGSWLVAFHPEHVAREQQVRLAWLDSLIKEFSA